MKTPHLLLSLLALTLLAAGARAQTTAFTFQGRLNDTGVPASGSYDLQLKLYDTAGVGTGTQVGATITLSAVPVTNGVFTVQPDFTANAFPGADRFVEVGVKPAGNATAFNILSPRQPITPTPYAIRSGSAITADSATNATNAGHASNADNATNATHATNADNASNATNATHATNADNAATATNATQLGGQPASGYVQSNDARLTDARAPTSGSANYLQNTTTQQTSANFNISGNGTAAGILSANLVNTASEYDIAGDRVLSLSGSGDFPRTNTFIGDQAGVATTPANSPVFTGISNSFFGSLSGRNNTVGYDNSFFGRLSGYSNGAGIGNTFVGQGSGSGNTSGSYNVSVGEYTGDNHKTGDFNTFVGAEAGISDASGTANTFIGGNAGNGSGTLARATAIGANATVTQNDSLVLGEIAGVNRATANTSVGVGTTAPQSRFHVKGTSWFQGDSTPLPAAAAVGIAIGSGSYPYIYAFDYGTFTAQNLILNNPGGNVGIGTAAPARTLDVKGRARVESIPLEASTASVCFNQAGDLVQCGASSLRWKTNVQPFTGGLDIVRRLRPISFDWTESELPDMGLAAEEVAQVEPSFVFKNSKGEPAGVKYERLNMALINAVQQQQEEIEQLKVQVGRLRAVSRARRK